MSGLHPNVEPVARLLNDMFVRLEEGTRTIFDLQRRVAILEGKEVVEPKDPEQVQFQNGVLSFTVANAEFVDFIDIRVNNVWHKFFPESVPQKSTFKRDGINISVQIPTLPVPIQRIEVFTRYDKYTMNSQAGRAVWKVQTA